MTKKALKFAKGDNVAVAAGGSTPGDVLLINGERNGRRREGSDSAGPQGRHSRYPEGRRD
jgi:hypothetical protein